MNFTKYVGKARPISLAFPRPSRLSFHAYPRTYGFLRNYSSLHKYHVVNRQTLWKPLIARQRKFSSTVASRSRQPASEPVVESNIITDLTPLTPAAYGATATVTISNPKRLNSLNRGAISNLTATLNSLASNPDLRCLVIKGASTDTKSPSFTSGADIFQMARLNSYYEAREFISGLHEACRVLRGIPVVTIAQIDGLCLGGGLELAAACDFRYATRRSTFSMPEAKYGIPSVIEARLLANIIGWQKTKEMVYFAKSYNTEEVERLGLVNQSCDTPEQLEAIVAQAVATVVSYGPKTMREQKKLVSIWEESDLITGVRAGIDSFACMFHDGGSEPKHYMRAFIDRKKQ